LNVLRPAQEAEERHSRTRDPAVVALTTTKTMCLSVASHSGLRL